MPPTPPPPPPPPPYDARIEYLESSGTQWIDTGIECTSDLKVQFQGLIKTSTNAAACGGINITAPYFRHHWSPVEDSFYWIQRDNSSEASVKFVAATNRLYDVTIDPTNGTGEINGGAVSFAPLSSSFTTGQNYYIFARKASNGTTQSRPCQFQFFRIWKGNELLRDYIPVRVGNVGYLYDQVSGQLFGNSGTGDFILGPDIE